jgi:hypothetical protein
MATLPVVAFAGTVAMSDVGDDPTTAAATPLNDTAFSAAVALNPVPMIVTVVPGGPLSGERLASVIGAASMRWMPTMFPAAS